MLARTHAKEKTAVYLTTWNIFKNQMGTMFSDVVANSEMLLHMQVSRRGFHHPANFYEARVCQAINIYWVIIKQHENTKPALLLLCSTSFTAGETATKLEMQAWLNVFHIFKRCLGGVFLTRGARDRNASLSQFPPFRNKARLQAASSDTVIQEGCSILLQRRSERCATKGVN